MDEGGGELATRRLKECLTGESMVDSVDLTGEDARELEADSERGDSMTGEETDES